MPTGGSYWPGSAFVDVTAPYPPAGRAAGETSPSLVLLVRNPWWLYAFWEVAPEDWARAEQASGRGEPVLRIYHLSEGTPTPPFTDMPAGDRSGGFVEVPGEGRTYAAAVGLRTPAVFYGLACSQRVTTPPGFPSDEADSDWRPLETLIQKQAALLPGLSSTHLAASHRLPSSPPASAPSEGEGVG